MAIISVISYTTPIFLVPVSIIMIFYCFVQQVYVSTSRQLKRLESVLKSPIYSHFGETLNGTTTIKAFKMENDFIKQSEDLVDQHHKVNIWILFRSFAFTYRKYLGKNFNVSFHQNNSLGILVTKIPKNQEFLYKS